MMRYTLFRVLSSIISLLLISIILFFLSKSVPGDPVNAALNISAEESQEIAFLTEYKRVARAWDLDKANFYFSVLPSNFPSHVNIYIPQAKKKWMRKFLFQGYNAKELTLFYDQSYALGNDEKKLNNLDNEKLIQLKNGILKANSIDEIAYLFQELDDRSPEIISLIKNFESLTIKKFYLIPKFHWHGTNNQYHLWIKGFLSGKPGNSFVDNRPVSDKISRAFIWTAFFVILGLISSYLIGIFVGIILNLIKSRFWIKFIERALFGIYAIPLFWLATLLMVFFTTSEYGSWTNIFPSVGLVPIDTGAKWYIRIADYGSQLILPTFCLVLHNLAFLSMITKRNLVKYKKSPFVLSARSYGFNEWQILNKEVLPHALMPLITSISSALPAAISGSLIIEIIFNIPGIGRLLFNGIINYDWPVVYTIVMLIAVITIFSFWMADILYRWADPRIKYKIKA